MENEFFYYVIKLPDGRYFSSKFTSKISRHVLHADIFWLKTRSVILKHHIPEGSRWSKVSFTLEDAGSIW